MAVKFAAAAKAGTALTQPTFRPRHFFFYGSLMDPEVFQTITKSTEAPVMRKGWIKDFKMRVWGIYPTLVPETETETATEATITGTWFMVDSSELEDGIFNFERYQRYFKPSVVRQRPSE